MYKITLIFASLIPILALTACGKLKETYQLGSALYLVGAMNHWDKFSEEKNKAGIIRTKATPSELSYLKQRLDTEYVASIDKLGKMAGGNPMAYLKNPLQGDLKKANTQLFFPINEAYSLKDKVTKKTFGYCVDHDITAITNGVVEKNEKTNHMFSYVDLNEKISFFTIGDDFIKNLCGEKFHQSVTRDDPPKSKK